MHVLTLTLRALGRWLIRAAYVLLILAAALWAGLRWGIVPHVDHFRPQLERIASQELGVHVQAGQLSAEAGGLGFAFTAHDLDIAGAGGTDIRIRRVRVLFSVPSLLRGRLRQIVVDQPQVVARGSLENLKTEEGSPGHRGLIARAAWAWMLMQPEIAIRDGKVHWAPPGQPEQTLRAINLYYHGGLLRRTLRVALLPDEDTQTPWHLLGRWSRVWVPHQEGGGHPGSWSGRGYAEASDINGPRWNTWAFTLGAPVEPRWTQGAAAARAWLHWRGGTLETAHGDLALSASTLQLRQGKPALHIPALRSHLQWRRTETGWHVGTEDLRAENAADGTLPLGTAWSLSAEDTPNTVSHTLEADNLSLPWLSTLATQLLPAPQQALLAQARPEGVLKRARWRWQGALDAPGSWHLDGRVTALSIRPIPHAPARDGKEIPGIPGLRGATVDWQMNPQGGQATLAIDQGAASFPGVFAEPEIPLDQLNATLDWRRRDNAWAVNVPSLTLTNADAAGSFHGSWSSGTLPGDPGTLTLDGTLTRGNGARVWRYLPLAVPADARSYVQHAITQGDIRDASVQVHGPLRDFPFDQPGNTGVFRISGQVRNARFAYVPHTLQPASEPAWLALSKLQGTLTFDRAGMRVRDASADAEDTPGWSFSAIRADIADLDKPRVIVSASGKGKLDSALAIVHKSPIAGLIHHALDDASASGPASLQLKLDLPVDHLEHARVDGQVALQGNQIQLQTDGIPLHNARGGVHFNEQGFTIQNAQADLLGGSARISGGSMKDSAPGQPSIRIHAEGSATAEGLGAMQGWGPVPALARAWRGQSDYTADVTVTDGTPHIDVRSDLQGLTSQLPAPLAKPAEVSWPLRYTSDANGWTLRVADVLALVFAQQKTAGAAPRGSIAVGRAARTTPVLPASGVHMDIAAETLDASAWIAALAPDATAPAAPDKEAPANTADSAYLPTRWQIAAGTLDVADHRFHIFRGVATRSGREWDATIESTEAAGQVHYTEGTGNSPGAVRARLGRLLITSGDEESGARVDANADTNVGESADENTGQDAQDARKLPSIDLQAGAFVLDGHALGALDLQATHHAAAGSEPSAWSIRKLALTMPEAQFTAQGQWQGGSKRQSPGATRLDLHLDTEDAGKLLARLGFDGLLAQGKGSIQGQIHWTGSPTEPDIPSLGGTLELDMKSGRFLKTDPGVGRLLGVLSLQALPRRLTLDFRDLFSSGFAFDQVQSSVTLHKGEARTDDFRMRGVSAEVSIAGQVSLVDKTEHLRVTIVPKLDAGTAALGAALINPVLGAGAFIAQLALKGPLSAAATSTYEMTGTWADPHFAPVEPSKKADHPPPHLQPESGN